MRRGPYAKVGERNQGLLAQIRRVKADHPFWGYRRVWAYVRYVQQHVVTQKRVYRLMKLHGLLVPPNLRRKASRLSHRTKPRPTATNQWWGIDMSVPQQAALEMRVWPLAIGLQEQVANHRKRLGSKALVVSVAEKVPSGIR